MNLFNHDRHGVFFKSREILFSIIFFILFSASLGAVSQVEQPRIVTVTSKQAAALIGENKENEDIGEITAIPLNPAPLSRKAKQNPSNAQINSLVYTLDLVHRSCPENYICNLFCIKTGLFG